jgi:hypothetical protein
MDVANKFQRYAIFDQPASSYSFPGTIWSENLRYFCMSSMRLVHAVTTTVRNHVDDPLHRLSRKRMTDCSPLLPARMIGKTFSSNQ